MKRNAKRRRAMHAYDVCSGVVSLHVIFISSPILLQSLQHSKRFSPELLNFLVGVIFLSTQKDKESTYLPPFKPVGPKASLLCDKFGSQK
jgi:hypothetical protein